MCECGLITTRRAFTDHDCLNEVIDLTGDDESGEELDDEHYD